MGDLERKLPRFAYMPFGGGPRVCIGQRFAMMEAVLVLTTMAQRFSMEWLSDRKVTPFPSITLRPHGGVWLEGQGASDKEWSERRDLTPSPNRPGVVRVL